MLSLIMKYNQQYRKPAYRELKYKSVTSLWKTSIAANYNNTAAEFTKNLTFQITFKAEITISIPSCRNEALDLRFKGESR